MHDSTPTSPRPVVRRGVNASLDSIFAGLRPLRQHDVVGRSYFQFSGGMIRRQIGEGHSHEERRSRREARRLLRRYVFPSVKLTVPQIAAQIIADARR